MAPVPARYELHDGRILTWSLETHLVDHCNLRCASCCTLSPELPPWFADPADLERDLAALRPVLAPHLFKLTGGEPLLHPGICEILEVVRSSEIGGEVSVTTNGFLLGRIPERFWRLVDRVTISLYSSRPLPAEAVDEARRIGAAHGVTITVKEIDAFQRLDPPVPHDALAARAVHQGCWLRSRCHSVYRGRFYVCTRPPHLEQHLASRGRGEGLDVRDGVPLDAPELGRAILAALESAEPLASCRHCLGASGPWEAHRQEGRVVRRRGARWAPDGT